MGPSSPSSPSLISATFVACFVSWNRLVHEVLDRPLQHTGTVSAVAFVAAAILFDFGWFRDQMCTLACPYGRLQNVMADPDTVLGGLRRGAGRAEGHPEAAPRRGGKHGDCIDCRLCVTTCPTGVDIRRGLQLECIGCAQCIDACDMVMVRTGRAPGLIRSTSERELKAGPGGSGGPAWWSTWPS